MANVLVALDPGQARDPSAIVVIERFDFVPPGPPPRPPYRVDFPLDMPEHERRLHLTCLWERARRDREKDEAVRPPTEIHYHVRHCERMKLGTPYTAVVGRTIAILGAVPGAEAVVDATGVGRAVIDLFEERRVYPIGITITGGETVTQDGPRVRVPKRHLIAAVEVLLQERRLKIARGIPQSSALVDELLSFRASVSGTGHDAFAAASSAHDDLVLALALACWCARESEKRPNLGPVAGTSEAYVDEDDPNPNWLGDPRDWHPRGYRGSARFLRGGVGRVTEPETGPWPTRMR